MATRPFEITRPDGRSHASVLIELVTGVEAGHLFTYPELIATLSNGAVHPFDQRRVGNVIRQTARRLLKEEQRVLANVPKIGYRVARAEDHQGLAIVRTKRADAQLHRGYQILRHVRTDELTETQRKLHEGTLFIVAGIYQNQRAMEKRLRAVETAIQGLRQQKEPNAAG